MSESMCWRHEVVLLFISYNEPRLSTRSNHTARNANHDHGAVGAGTDATWDREDCVVLQRWLGGYTSSRTPRTQGFQATWLCSTNPFPEPPTKLNNITNLFYEWVFFHVLPSPLDSAFRFRSSVVCFCASAPTWFPHTWTPIFKFGVSPACHRFLMFWKTCIYPSIWCSDPSWFSVCGEMAEN